MTYHYATIIFITGGITVDFIAQDLDNIFTSNLDSHFVNECMQCAKKMTIFGLIDAMIAPSEYMVYIANRYLFFY